MLSAAVYQQSDMCASRPRTAKHLTERKRRARINDSLLQLKSMVFPAVKKDISQQQISRQPKMEKADILEMTVRYLKEIQTSPKSGDKSTAGVTNYHAGFTECLSEVSTFMSSCESIDIETRLRLLGHLADRCSTINEPEQKPDVSRLQQEMLPSQPSPQAQARLSAPLSVSTPAASPVSHQMTASSNGMVILVPANSIQTTPISSPVISVRVPVSENLLTPPQSPVSLESPLDATRFTPSPVDMKIGKHSTDFYSHRVSPYQKHSQKATSAAKQMWRPW
uniref:Hairy and enhancer of split transcription factor C n=1 Tax=Echinocardium cordatum TaxID=39298 RepID=A0A0N7KB24_ECHCD|nr:hairy and enhancer of split transcription factor C [Echinocardium cordatum]